jgi:hypothetical protein
MKLVMEPYGAEAAAQYPLNFADDWLRKRQGLALPVLPPTTPEARKYFFSKIREFSETASVNNKKTVNFEAFAQEWNRTADGEERFYVTVEVLSSYAKSWEKMSNIHASQELISQQMKTLVQSSEIFAAAEQEFPYFLTSIPTQIQPSRGVIELHDSTLIPRSLSTALPLSRAPILEVQQLETLDIVMQLLENPVTHDGGLVAGPALHIDEMLQSVERTGAKRRRVVPEDQRRRQAIRTCRRCGKATCPGNSDILKCPLPCEVPCKTCGRVEGCRGVDKGRKCSYSP